VPDERLSSLVTGLAFVTLKAVGRPVVTGLAAGATLVTRLSFIAELARRLVCQNGRDRGQGQDNRKRECDEFLQKSYLLYATNGSNFGRNRPFVGRNGAPPALPVVHPF